DEQLGAAVKELGEVLCAVLRLEAVVLFDRDPGQLAPFPGQIVAAAGEGLLLLQQCVALRLPLLLRADPVLRHRDATSCLRPRGWAAIHNHVLTGLLLELGDALRDLAFDQMGVLPLQVLERGRFGLRTLPAPSTQAIRLTARDPPHGLIHWSSSGERLPLTSRSGRLDRI